VVGFGLGLALGVDLVSGWLVVIHTCFYYFKLSLSLSQLDGVVVTALDLRLELAGSFAGQSTFKCNPWQVVHTRLPLSPRIIRLIDTVETSFRCCSDF